MSEISGTSYFHSADSFAIIRGGHLDLTVVIAMQHTARDGTHKKVERCTLPLTGERVVDLIVTAMAVIEVTPDGLVLKEVMEGYTADEVIAATGAALKVTAGK